MAKRSRIPIALSILAAALVSTFVFLNRTDRSLTLLSLTNGRVFMLKPDSIEWLEAKEGMTLDVDYSIRSEANARATIIFFDGSTVDLEGSTEIKLAELSNIGGNDKSVIVLIQEIGRTTSRIKKLIDPASRYEIETTAATVTMRGSIMYVEVTEYEKTVAGNEEGAVSLIAQGVEVRIPEGMHSSALPGQTPADPSPGVRPTSMSSQIFTDPTGDYFDKNGNRTQSDIYIDIVKSQIFYSDGQYVARIELNGTFPSRTSLPSTFIEWDVLVDADRNPNTGFKWPLIGNDIGYDYLIRVSLTDATRRSGIMVIGDNTWQIVSHKVKDNVVELYFPADTIKNPGDFDFVVAVRKYLETDAPNQPSFSDKAPDMGHYTFSIQGMTSR